MPDAAVHELASARQLPERLAAMPNSPMTIATACSRWSPPSCGRRSPARWRGSAPAWRSPATASAASAHQAGLRRARIGARRQPQRQIVDPPVAAQASLRSIARSPARRSGARSAPTPPCTSDAAAVRTAAASTRPGAEAMQRDRTFAGPDLQEAVASRLGQLATSGRVRRVRRSRRRQRQRRPRRIPDDRHPRPPPGRAARTKSRLQIGAVGLTVAAAAGRTGRPAHLVEPAGDRVAEARHHHRPAPPTAPGWRPRRPPADGWRCHAGRGRARAPPATGSAGDRAGGPACPPAAAR